MLTARIIKGTTTDQKEPVVHELWASDIHIALEGLLAILSG
jgi:hypothetical protein